MMIVMLFSSSGVVCPSLFIQSYFSFGFFISTQINISGRSFPLHKLNKRFFYENSVFLFVSGCGTVDDRVSCASIFRQ